jgi:hypothetical protein
LGQRGAHYERLRTGRQDHIHQVGSNRIDHRARIAENLPDPKAIGQGLRFRRIDIADREDCCARCLPALHMELRKVASANDSNSDAHNCSKTARVMSVVPLLPPNSRGRTTWMANAD